MNILLEPQHKKKITAQFAELKPAARLNRLEQMRVARNIAIGGERAALSRVIAFAESVHTQLVMAERHSAPRPASPKPAQAKISLLPEGWTPTKAGLFVALSVSAVGMMYAAIPALIALLSIVGAVLGYIVAAAFAFFLFMTLAKDFLTGIRIGKESQCGQRIVNIHVEQNDTVNR